MISCVPIRKYPKSVLGERLPEKAVKAVPKLKVIELVNGAMSAGQLK